MYFSYCSSHRANSVSFSHEKRNLMIHYAGDVLLMFYTWSLKLSGCHPFLSLSSLFSLVLSSQKFLSEKKARRDDIYVKCSEKMSITKGRARRCVWRH